MKKVFLGLACLAVLAIFASPAMALDTTWYPGSSPVGLDARAFGMGGACLATVDPWSTPTNPAALTYLTAQGLYVGRFVNPPLYFDPAFIRGDQEYVYLTYAHPAGEMGAYALTLYRNEYWDVFTLDAAVEHFTTEFTGIQYSYAYAFSDRLSAGFSIRWLSVTESIYDTGESMGHKLSSRVFSADIGALYKISNNVTAAVMVTDILSPMIDWDPISPVPFLTEIEPRILFGGAFQLGQSFLLAVDVDYNIDSKNDLEDMTRYGLEFRPLKFLAVRAGSYYGDLTLGFGFTLGDREDEIELCLDFGQRWEDNGELVSEVQCMQMTVHF